MTKKVFKVDGMDCSACVMEIDGELEDNGAQESKTSYAKSLVEVKFDPSKISESDIIKKIKKLGYKVHLLQ